MHNIEPVDSASQFSLRIDGLFNNKFRDLIVERGTFWSSDSSSNGADDRLRAVFAQQQDGPRFLKEYNEPPASDDDADEDTEGEG